MWVSVLLEDYLNLPREHISRGVRRRPCNQVATAPGPAWPEAQGPHPDRHRDRASFSATLAARAYRACAPKAVHPRRQRPSHLCGGPTLKARP